jgi:hypothetical protein
VPLLTGIPSAEFYEGRNWNDPWDPVPFIWTHFAAAHYATSYIEDIPALGTFNYGGQTGFRYPPTDLYIRPLFTAWETLTDHQPKTVSTP